MQPAPYNITTDFSQEEAGNVAGRSSVRTAQLDAEFGNIATSLNQVIGNLALIQRDDGKPADASIQPSAFDAATLALIASTWTPKGSWVTATAYVVGDVVEESAATYVCATAHTSGTFATDHVAGKWVVLAQSVSLNNAALTGVPTAPTASPGTNTTQVATAEFVQTEIQYFSKINVANTFTKSQNVQSVALTTAGTIDTNASLGNVFTCTLNQAGHTLANPTNLIPGGTYIWCLDQDATGGRTITTYGNKFLWASGVVPTLSTAANAKDVLSGVCDANGNLRCTLTTGFS